MYKPLVSILIPIYNGAETIEEAINSCFNQTYSNFELLIYNDGSTDSSQQLIKNIEDHRIVFIDSTTNNGIAFSRNTLLKHAKGEFIAWLDADDKMLHNRLEIQIEYFLNHPEIDICGSWMYLKNNSNSNINTIAKTVCNSELLHTALLFKNYIFQPTVMSRNFYLNESIFYNSEFDYLEDYELWLRIHNTKKIANIPVPLIEYGATEVEILQKRNHYQFENKQLQLLKKRIHVLVEKINEEEINLLQKFIYNNWQLSEKDLYQLSSILNRIQFENKNQWTIELMIAFHKLRIWKHLNSRNKLLHIALLFNAINYLKIKSYYLY